MKCAAVIVVVVAPWLIAGCGDHQPDTTPATGPKHMHTDHTPPPTHTNRLAQTTSPYLLQHAHNPVDWRPWGDEAFELARKENKPIFLSVGYSTCHWCHVMAHESFEDEAVAAVLNERYVSIKVDREELPDVDAQYMLATQAFYQLSGLNRGGGWPNSVWLMPDGRAYYAGTYFPKPQFVQLLVAMSDAYCQQPEQVEAQAKTLTRYVKLLGEVRDEGEVEIDRALIERGVSTIVGAYDDEYGGFGGRPKFPPHGNLELLIGEYRRGKSERLLGVITGTLDAMMRGGVYDHVGGGFHRYSTDERWFLPHFEKMLYDNAQLIAAYADAYELTGDERYKRVVAETYDWIAREMTDERGGFYSALDADSEGEEGRFYVWAYDEIVETLGAQDAAVFVEAYGVGRGGNFVEEATGERMPTNVLYLPKSIDEGLQARLRVMRGKLLAQRNKRVRPHLDDKVLTSWNGLMIEALAHAGKVLNEPRYTRAAERAAGFALDSLRDERGRLYRTYRDGEARLPGYLDDYAYLCNGLVELHETTGDGRWLETARELAATMSELFADAEGGGFYYTSAAHDEKIFRSKNPNSGGNVPNANASAARALLRLGRLTGDARDTLDVHRTLDLFAPVMASNPYGGSELLAVSAAYLADEKAVAVVARAHGSAQGPQPDAASAAKPVSVAAFVSHDRVRAGDTLRVAVRLTIDEPYHVYAPQEAGDDVITTAVTLAEGEGVKLIDVEYPLSHEMEDAVFGKALRVYTGEVWVRVALKVERAGPFKLGVRTQACDDRSCLLPTTQALTLSVGVGDDGTLASRNSAFFDDD